MEISCNVPDLGAKGREHEARAREHGAGHRGLPAAAGPAPREGREKQRHREVEHARRRRADDARDVAAAAQRPVVREVLLEDAVAHGEACGLRQ